MGMVILKDYTSCRRIFLKETETAQTMTLSLADMNDNRIWKNPLMGFFFANPKLSITF